MKNSLKYLWLGCSLLPLRKKLNVESGVLGTLFIHFIQSYVLAKNLKFFFLEHVTKKTIRSTIFVQSFRNLFSQHISSKRLLSHNSAQKRRIKEISHFKGMIGSSLWLDYWREQTLFRSIKRHHKTHKSSMFTRIFLEILIASYYPILKSVAVISSEHKLQKKIPCKRRNITAEFPDTSQTFAFLNERIRRMKKSFRERM